jgi:hypothetical protein
MSLPAAAGRASSAGSLRSLRALTSACVDTVNVVATDGTVQVWRLDSGAPVGEPWRGQDRRVSAVAVGGFDGRPVVLAGDWYGTVGVWQPSDEGTQQVIDLGSAVHAVAIASSRQAVVGTTMGVVVLRLGSAGGGAAGR